MAFDKLLERIQMGPDFPGGARFAWSKPGGSANKVCLVHDGMEKRSGRLGFFENQACVVARSGA